MLSLCILKRFAFVLLTKPVELRKHTILSTILVFRTKHLTGLHLTRTLKCQKIYLMDMAKRFGEYSNYTTTEENKCNELL